MRHLVAGPAALALTWMALSGCVSQASRPTTGPATPEQPLSRLTVATPTADHDVLAQLLDAQFALDHNDLQAAAKAYGKAAMLSDNPEVAQRAVGLAIAVHDGAAARRGLARWRALGADPAELARARAELALDEGNTDEARKQLDRLVDSGDKDAWRLFGRVLMGARDAAQAGQLLQAIATPERLPDDPRAWLAMSEMGSKLNQHAYARRLAKAAVERFHCADCYAWAAQLQLKSGHQEKARTLYAEAVRKDPDSSRLRLGYASLLGQTGDPAKAERVLAKGPQDAATYRARAAYAARAEDKAALKRIYTQLRHAPDPVQAQSHYLMGQLAATMGDVQQALDWFAQVPADDPHRFDADLHSALLLQQQGHPDRAHRQAQQMQTDFAEDPDQLRRAIRLDAELYLMESNYPKAVAGFSRALKMAPDDPDLLYGRGMAYAQSGNIDAAVADFRHLLKVKPGDISAANALGYTLADANRDLAEATRLITRAHEARPHDPAITDSWGWLQYRLGHLAAAEKALRQAWKAGQDPQIGAHLAEVLWKQGDRDQAREVLAAARKRAPHDAALRDLQRKIGP